MYFCKKSNPNSGMTGRILKISIICCWLLLLVLLVQRDFFVTTLDSSEQATLTRARYEQYYGVYLQDKRIGYVMEDFRPTETGDFQVRQLASMRLKVLKTVQPVQMELHAKLNSGLRLTSFTFTFSSPFYSTSAKGYVKGSTVHFTLDTGQATIEDSITLQAEPILPLNQRGYLLTAMTKPGQKRKLPFFDPFSLTARQSVITYQGKDKLLINNRIRNLHFFTESYSGMQISFWMNDKGKIIREKSPAGFVFKSEPKFKAMDIQDSGDELLAMVAVKYTGNLLPEQAESAAFKLKIPAENTFDLNGGRQQYSNGLVTLNREIFPPSPVNADNDNCAATDSLQPSRYIQSNDPSVIRQAKEIVGSETDPVRQVVLLTEWVYENLEKRPVLGLPDALTTLKNKRGDCNEHAALFAALARSLNIPTMIAAGVTMYNNAFYYHAWNEVCLNGQWISLDSTTNQLPADLYHIRFILGDLEGQLAIGSLLGKLQIEILPQTTEAADERQ